MKRTLFAVALLLTASSMFAADTTRRYVVAMRGGVPARETFRQLDADFATGRRALRVFPRVQAAALDLTDAEAARLRQEPDVIAVEPAMERHLLDSTPVTNTELIAGRNPNGQTTPYGISLVNAQQVWPYKRGDAINVAVLDTGIDYNHPDLKAQYQGGYNEISKTDDPLDNNGHGTHVSGTISASDNDLGVVGVAPHVKLWSVKVLNASGSGRTDGIIAGIDWVIARKLELGGNWIMSLSLGSEDSSLVEEQAFQRAADAGILTLAASGNASTAGVPAAVSYPAAYPSVVAIGAIDAKSAVADFSNQGPELALVAPGVDVLSTLQVGKGSIAYVGTGSSSYSGAALTGSVNGTVTGKFVFCGFGQPSDFTSAVNGKIAVISRGAGVTFHDKTQRAKNAGAIGVIIYNNDDSALSWTLIGDDPADQTYAWPTAIGITREDGAALVANAGATLTITQGPDDYGFLSGTSMATPHASGVAALVWSVAPNATAAQVRQALTSTAHDLGASGFDPAFGNGLIDAFAAAKALAPAVFANPATPAPPTPTNGGFNGRRIMRRP
ncbi:MAG TPA: S8 family serine peptidase [Thermoanaerobaculia bacterium]|jgi:subtilisin family serine protease|nr:S8 family serine peptidase [Thermoanaerobaculia bacterium]